MTIEEKQYGSVAVLSLRGDFWRGTAWDVHQKVKSLIENNTKHVVLDFSLIDRINSQGIGAVVASLKVIRDTGGDLRIACANQHIKDTFRVVNLFTILEECDTIEQAIEKFGI